MSIKKSTISIEFDEIDHYSELPQEEQDLVKLAFESAAKAYAPYSGFFVGAAILLKNGKIFSGNNQENVAYPSGLCAERVAIFHAKSLYPDIPVQTVVVVAQSELFPVVEPVSPCGSCRQVLAEYEAKDKENIKIILCAKNGKTKVVSNCSSLLPLVFREKGLMK